ncbi:MAG: hypothetical protein V1760_03645 [Candidatus Peregrinibacteria bacterium]
MGGVKKTASDEDTVSPPRVEPEVSQDPLAKGVAAEAVEEVTTLQERTIAALSYVGFFAIVPFYLKKNSKFCRFHGKQGMLVALIFFFAKLLLVLDLLMDVALVLQFVVFVWMGFNALSGRWTKLPWIYNMSCQLEKALSFDQSKEEGESSES